MYSYDMRADFQAAFGNVNSNTISTNYESLINWAGGVVTQQWVDSSYDGRLPEDPIVLLSKVLPRGAVQIPVEIREKLDLRPGTRLIVGATGDTVVPWKTEVLLSRKRPSGVMAKTRSIFSRLPIRNIEESSSNPRKVWSVTRCR